MTSACELSEGEVTFPSNLKVVGALDNYSLVFVIFINFFWQLKDWVGQVLFLVSCPKGQVEKYVNVEACTDTRYSKEVSQLSHIKVSTYTRYSKEVSQLSHIKVSTKWHNIF